ncbi:MAG: MBL fold metallo-hydrolase [Bdellovibrionota bacterium]
MKIRFWGVRGSIPTPGPDFVKFGGNTSCIELEDNSGNIFVFDSGTGIRPCGLDLAKRKIKDIHLFITHTHWDHIQGFPFFTPAYIPGTTIHIYGPIHFEKKLKHIMDLQMDYAYFPISMQQLNAKIEYSDLKEAKVKIGDTLVSTKYSNHPVTGLCYKISCGGKTLVYSGDTEPYYNNITGADAVDPSGMGFAEEDDEETVDDVVRERNEHHKLFCASDMLIHDAQYTEEEYEKFKGWGHSPMETVIKMAIDGGVKRLVLNHHDPAHTDDMLLETEAKLKAKYPQMDLIFSREGMELTL